MQQVLSAGVYPVLPASFLLEDKSFIPSQLTTVRMIGAGAITARLGVVF